VKRTCVPIAIVFAAAVSLQAQSNSNPLSADVRQTYNAVKANLSKAAEKVPEEDYSFKPTPETRTVAEILEHVVSSQFHSCGAVLGNGHAPSPSAAGSKANIVSALKQSFEECDKAFDSLTDANATEKIKLPWGEKTKLGALAGIANHDTEQYAILGVYMRLKGIVPPSSEHAPRR
jgi:uncharacterized damage-inducible protein DinB